MEHERPEDAKIRKAYDDYQISRLEKQLEYQGWPNRATWNVSMYLNGDPELEAVLRHIVTTYDQITAANELAELCFESWGDVTPDGLPLESVDWIAVVDRNLD